MLGRARPEHKEELLQSLYRHSGCPIFEPQCIAAVTCAEFHLELQGLLRASMLLRAR